LAGHANTHALELRNVSKSFGGTRALSDVSLTVGHSEIMALAGHNGSGKSTLIKVLSGFHRPDPGCSAWVGGEPIELGSARSADHCGLRFVHQDLALVLELSAADNIALAAGYERTRLGNIKNSRQIRLSEWLIQQLGIDLDPTMPLTQASAVERAAVAIARALWDWEAGTRVLVLDEPTARLPHSEVTRLLDVVRRVRTAGNAVIYVSHRMHEIFEIADTVTVLREGRIASKGPIADYTPDRLSQLIAGDDDFRHVGSRQSNTGSRYALRVSGLSGKMLRGVDVDVREREVVGIAGLLGSGREEITYAMAGIGKDGYDGEWDVGGTRTNTMDTRRARELGIALVPGERLREGLIADFSVRENLTLGSLGRLRRFGSIFRHDESALSREWIRRFNIPADVLEWNIGALSGGNQQRILLARWLAADPSVLLLSEPTAGVDVAARASLYRQLRESVEAGLSLVVASSDAEDLVNLCDRVLILHRGTVAAELTREDISVTNIVRFLDGLT
jgi:ribose transport system ATP-binding protein